jgi:hypothetical protein
LSDEDVLGIIPPQSPAPSTQGEDPQ